MREFTNKDIKELMKNPYTYKVTKHKLYFSVEFKEAFWIKYQAGTAPKKILVELGYKSDVLGQKTLDSLVQRIKKAALSGEGFKEGECRERRRGVKPLDTIENPKTVDQMQHELLYLRQEVDFLKKILKSENRKNDR